MESSDVPNPLLHQIPKECFWEQIDIYQWEGFWYASHLIDSLRAFQTHFKACDDDVILASSVKTGTTWLKALSFCIMDQQHCSGDGNQEAEKEDPLLNNIPHSYVKTIESQIYGQNAHPHFSTLPSRRLFHTNVPYTALPDSIKNSSCKIVYLPRNPKDTLVSLWFFLNSIWRPNQDPFPLEKAFENFCNGVHLFGPFFDHALHYWTESLKMPHRVLFLKYEELKKNPKGQVKRLASFLGRPFEEDEIDKVLWRCRGRLKNLEVNKNGMSPWETVPNKAFFRDGNVGDWKKHLSSEMAEQLDQITHMKLHGSGLDFGIAEA